MKRRNYDAKIISVFDTIGSFFVDTFYNNHYLLAKSVVGAGQARSITDAYRGIIIKYMDGLNSSVKNYMTVVRKLHSYYQEMSGFGAVVFSDFEDKIVSKFIPPEYYAHFEENRKDTLLHEIIIKTVNEMGRLTLSKNILFKIIDDHSNVANVGELQDKIVGVLITIREDYYSKFVQVISKGNAVDNVSVELFEKLKAAFVLEKKRKIELEENKGRAERIVRELVKKLKQAQSENSRMQTENNKLHAEISKLRESISKMQIEVNNLRADHKPIPWAGLNKNNPPADGHFGVSQFPIDKKKSEPVKELIPYESTQTPANSRRGSVDIRSKQPIGVINGAREIIKTLPQANLNPIVELDSDTELQAQKSAGENTNSKTHANLETHSESESDSVADSANSIDDEYSDYSFSEDDETIYQKQKEMLNKKLAARVS